MRVRCSTGVVDTKLKLQYRLFKMDYEDVEILAAIENQEINENIARYQRRKEYKYRDAFNMSDNQFVKHFRLNKELAVRLINILQPYVRDKTRVSAISTETKVLVALNFFATGCYQLPTGANEHLALSQPSVSRCIREVVDGFNHPEVLNEYIHFPNNIQELNTLRQQFYEKYGMPGVVGCIDCTHVAIFPPSQNIENYPEHIYLNRKHYHSINTQLICDLSMKIMHVNARFLGSTHDAFIWANSNVEPVVRNIYNRGRQGYFLLGDSGYCLRPWLLTPLVNAHEREEVLFNERHKTIRSVIERCIGLLKMRFRCLLKHRVLHYSPTCSRIINACAVLHNMCIDANLALNNDNVDDIAEDFEIFENNPVNIEHIHANNPDLLAGRQMQRRIINHLQ